MKIRMLLLFGLLAIASSACGGGEPGTVAAFTGDDGVDNRYADPAGWSLAYPAEMQLERSAGRLRISVAEVTVANFAARAAVRTETTPEGGSLYVDPPRDLEGRFPADGVAFRVLDMEGGPAPTLDLAETRFPIRLADFKRSSAYPGTQPRPLERLVVAGGRRYIAYAWLGPAASQHWRTQLERVVASLSFPPLQPGRTVGYGFLVLQPARRYPVGSFTRIRAKGRPFYLVHAPGGFYAIGWRGVMARDGYLSRCRLELDRSRREFFCSNLGARWDRVGRVIRRPPQARRGDPLYLALVKVAWDGHVLLHPGSASFATIKTAQRLWPAK